MIYQIEKHTTVQFIVTAQREKEGTRIPIAKCNNEATALTIKGLYEKAEAEDLCRGELTHPEPNDIEKGKKCLNKD